MSSLLAHWRTVVSVLAAALAALEVGHQTAPQAAPAVQRRAVAEAQRADLLKLAFEDVRAERDKLREVCDEKLKHCWATYRKDCR